MNTPTNSEMEREFFGAINRGDAVAVQKMVANQPVLLDAYDYDCFGATPLTSVTFRDDRELIDVLLDLGADPNRRSDWDMGPWSPLHSAIHCGHNELAEHLLSRGADLDVHTAAALGRIDALNQMLDAAPERVSERGGDGCTPLHFVGSIDAVDLLLERGADLEARCIDHYSTPVQYRAQPNPEIARYLVSKGAIPDIFSAALSGDIETIQRLVQQDADLVHARINRDTFPPGPDYEVDNIMTFSVGGNCTPLHAAMIGDHPEVIKWLVNAGADPNARGGYDDATPLHSAAWHDNLAAAKAIIESGADMNLRSGEIHENSPAGWAIVAGSADVFCLLMDHGCEVLDFFEESAQAAVDGVFRQYKSVPQENYLRVQRRLTADG